MEPSFTNRPYPVVEGVEIKHRFVDIGTLKIHIAEAGSGEPLIMYHGWPQNWWMWRNQIPLFAKYFHVIVPDMRGFGWSEVTDHGYLKDDLSKDFEKLVHALGYKQVKLLSHDWGGWIGYIASAMYPGLISQHFATNIPPIWPKISYKMIPATFRFGYMFRMSIPWFGSRMLMNSSKFVHHLLTRGGRRREGWTEYEKNIFSDQFKEPARAKASAKLYGSFLYKEYIPLGLFGKYKKLFIKTPTRLLFGENDFALALSWLRGYEKHVDDFEIELVPDTGHFIVDERPDLVNEKALQFFLDEKYNKERPLTILNENDYDIRTVPD
ncbi:MAG: alpha/beta hydrolase [Saprospiraceae bacterium]